jgi:hypothetical protein
MQLIKSLSIISLLSAALAAPMSVKDREAQIEALGREAGASDQDIKTVKDRVLKENDGNEDAEDRGILGMALDLLTGTTPEASVTPGGLVVHTGGGGQFHQSYPGAVPGYGFPPYYGGFRPF